MPPYSNGDYPGENIPKRRQPMSAERGVLWSGHQRGAPSFDGEFDAHESGGPENPVRGQFHRAAVGGDVGDMAVVFGPASLNVFSRLPSYQLPATVAGALEPPEF